jgi:hypothetical protein
MMLNTLDTTMRFVGLQDVQFTYFERYSPLWDIEHNWIVSLVEDKYGSAIYNQLLESIVGQSSLVGGWEAIKGRLWEEYKIIVCVRFKKRFSRKCNDWRN